MPSYFSSQKNHLPFTGWKPAGVDLGLAAVNSRVHCEIVFGCKAFSAIGALERLLQRVSSLVELQVAGRGKLFAAMAADQTLSPLFLMSRFFRFLGRLRRIPVTRLDMAYQMYFPPKGERTVVALEYVTDAQVVVKVGLRVEEVAAVGARDRGMISLVHLVISLLGHLVISLLVHLFLALVNLFLFRLVSLILLVRCLFLIFLFNGNYNLFRFF